MIPSRADKRAFEVYRHSIEMANLDGKEIEKRVIKTHYTSEWQAREPFAKGTPLDWIVCDYRLAPEPPSVTPWTFETVPVGSVIRHKHQSLKAVIIEADNERASIEGASFTYKQILEHFEQTNGEPCGVKAEAWPKWFRSPSNSLWRVDSENRVLYFSRIRQELISSSYDTRVELLSEVKKLVEITAAEAEALLKGVK